MSPPIPGPGLEGQFLSVLLVLLHGAGSAGASPPVPHWVVLLAAVPALWLVIAGAVAAVDRLLSLLGLEE